MISSLRFEIVVLGGKQLSPDLLEIFSLMFADDIPLMSETVIGLQMQLNALQKYSTDWQLEVNIMKTKIVIFRKGGRIAKKEYWSYNNNPIEMVNLFSYVGVCFTNNVSSYKMAEYMLGKSKKVLICLLKNVQSVLPLSYKTFCKIVDANITQILVYGAERWGLKRIETVKRFQICYLCLIG